MGSLRLPSALLRSGLYATALMLAAVPGARAQDAAAPAHIAFVDGSVSLDRDGQAQEATAGMPFVPGDRVRTTNGRVEVLFPDGSALDIDEYSSIELQSATLLRLTSGRVILIVSGANDPANAVRYQIDTPVASANTEGPGEYRIALLSGPTGVEAELAVLRGSAALRTERGSTPIRAGERSLARDLEAPSFPQAFNSARFDAFDRWAAARRDARTGTSARYLPRDLQMYGGTFDRYGGWQHDAAYGYVWYPVVAPDWRPYYYGYWAPVRPYGWTWIGFDSWGWPTHHYGRWGFAHDRWFWIPHHGWAPAWVTWATAPDYVSWCPLGFDNRPVFALTAYIGSARPGWVAVNRTHFGAHRGSVHRYAVDRVPATAAIAAQTTAPVPLPHAVPRGSVGPGTSADGAIRRSPGRDVAVPRQSPFASPLPAAGQPSAVGGQQLAGGSRGSAVRNPRLALTGPRLDVGREVSSAPDANATFDSGGARAGRSGATVRQPAAIPGPATGSTPLKQPLPDVPRAWHRNSGVVSPRDGSGDSSPRAVDRSSGLPQASPWHGQSSGWYGSTRRAPTDPPAMAGAPGRRSPYSRQPSASPAPTMPVVPAASWPAPVPNSQGAVPRWSVPSVARPAPAAAPQQFSRPAPVMRSPFAVPRDGSAGSAPAAAPRGPAPAPSGGEAAPRHAPASRRPS